MAARSRARIDDFDDFVIGELPDLAHLGNEVLNRVRGMPLAEKALTALYLTHLREAPPAHFNPNPNPNPNPIPNPNPNPNPNTAARFQAGAGALLLLLALLSQLPPTMADEWRG